LEAGLQTRSNVTLISEEIEAKKMSLDEVVGLICRSVKARAAQGKNYGVVLVPEGLVEFIPSIKPIQVYEALLDGKKHSRLIGSKCTGKAAVGSSFTAWDGYISGKVLELEFRPGVTFQNGDPLTSDDFKFTFLDRIRADTKLGLSSSWNNQLEGLETPSPRKAVMHFRNPFPLGVNVIQLQLLDDRLEDLA